MFYILRKTKKYKMNIVILLICSIIICTSLGTYPHTIVYAAQTGEVTATSLNVRKGPGTNYDIVELKGTKVSLKKGEIVTINSKKDGWYQITATFNKKAVDGYVSADYIKIKKDDNTSNNNPSDNNTSITKVKDLNLLATATVNALNVRKKAGTSGAKLTADGNVIMLSKNQKVTILSEIITDNQKWYYISFSYNNKTKKGYAISDYIQLSPQKAIKALVNSYTKVKVQTAAGEKKPYLQQGGKTVSLKDGKAITISTETTIGSVKWYKINFTYNSEKLSGFIPANKVLFKTTTVTATPKPTPKPTEDPDLEDPDLEDPDLEDPDLEDPELEDPDLEDPELEDPEETIAPTNIPQVSATPKPSQGNMGTIINITGLKVRKGASETSDQLRDSRGIAISLNSGETVTILTSVTAIDGSIWFYVSFNWNGIETFGYINSSYVSTNSSPGISPKPTPTNPPIDLGTPLTDAQFEQQLSAQQFPESYKPALRVLHKQYPYWKFEAYHTGLDWNTALQRESTVGLNLIPNSSNIAYKSIQTGCYNWLQDTFTIFDGSTWVTASQKAVAYYMDPRNFLNTEGIFQFEILSYQPSYQTSAGVEKILYNTPLYNKTYSYKSDSGTTETITYADTFIKAAQYSGVSPFQLATRAKQEVVTGTTSLSSAVTGTVAGYLGIYNFYNIGATHSTAQGGSVTNGLNFAKNGTNNTATNTLYLIPWNSPYKAILGGAQYIGSSYINKGQNTIYLQKFNVTPIETYSHQYMGNVQAAVAEATKTAIAYNSMGQAPIAFSIPVYSNMPQIVCALPELELNPNNWLNSLSLSGYTLSPAFEADVTEYTMTVPSNISSISINATAANKKASISGTGSIPLNKGNNNVIVSVKAENGDVREYRIMVYR